MQRQELLAAVPVPRRHLNKLTIKLVPRSGRLWKKASSTNGLRKLYRPALMQPRYRFVRGGYRGLKRDEVQNGQDPESARLKKARTS